MRLLIFLVIIYIAYKVLKTGLKSLGIFQNTQSTKTYFEDDGNEIDDVMVKDPYCEVYFPKRKGVHLRNNGVDLFFCSNECKDKFVSLGLKKK